MAPAMVFRLRCLWFFLLILPTAVDILVLLGFNFGLLVPYRSISVGGLFTGSFRFFTSTNEPFGAHHTMGLLAAVLL